MYAILVRTYNHIIGMVCMLKLIMKRLKIELYTWNCMLLFSFIYDIYSFESQSANYFDSIQKVDR